MDTKQQLTQQKKSDFKEEVTRGEGDAALIGAEPFLKCKSVRITLMFYRDVLGFSHLWYQGKPISSGGASRDSAHISFSRLKDGEQFSNSGTSVLVRCLNIESLYEEHTKKGAKIVSPIRKLPIGRKEYVVEDPNGYLIHFREQLTN